MFTNPLVASSRDIWSHGSGQRLRDLLTSSLLTLLLMGKVDRPVYISSPWISDFVLFDNRYREFASLFPELADQTIIYFSEYLMRLARQTQVRMITTRNEISEGFLDLLKHKKVSIDILCRFAGGEYHEKGFLAPSFYIEGSMNFTYSGVYVRGEKVTYYCGQGKDGSARILGAYLEFDRQWKLLE